MYQRWESLLFLHWKFPADQIQGTLPPGLTVDTFEGNAYVGVVPFLMRGIRPRFLPSVPGISDFLELNLRTYAKDTQGRPSVWFYSLDANQSLSVWVARKLFNLPYYRAEMKYWIDGSGCERFTSERPGSPEQIFEYKSVSSPTLAQPGSLSHFLVERYSLYAYKPEEKRLLRGTIQHEPYRLSHVELAAYSPELFSLNGLKCPDRDPDHAVLAEPVNVRIYPMRKVAA